MPKRGFIGVIILLAVLLIAIIAGVVAAMSMKKSATRVGGLDGNSQSERKLGGVLLFLRSTLGLEDYLVAVTREKMGDEVLLRAFFSLCSV